MAYADEQLLSLVLWRENRGGGYNGMQSVANAISNRVANNKSSFYAECVKPLQFSSLTAKGDPELTLWPSVTDKTWIVAQGIASDAVAGKLTDLTHGATLYYAPHSIQTDQTITLPNGSVIPFPKPWNKAHVEYTVTIADQVFFKEV